MMSAPRPVGALSLALTVVLAFAATAYAQDAQIARTIAAIKPSVVLITTADAQLRPVGCGSGFVIDPKGLVATCAHVLEDAAMVTVVLGGKRQVAAKIVGVDMEHDLAILKLPDGTECVSVQRSTDQIAEGRSVLATGYPFGTDLADAGLDLAATTTKGMITAIRKAKGFVNGLPMDLIQVDAKVNPGNSGGPLYYPETGEIIGVIAGEIAAFWDTGMNLAVPVSYLLELLTAVREGRAPAPPPGKVVKAPEKVQQPQPIARSTPATTTELPIPEIAPGGGLPVKAGGRMIADARRQKIYVCEPDGNSLAIVKTDDMTVEKRLAIGSRPVGLSLSPDGSVLYVAIAGGSQLVAVDPDKLTLKETLQLGFQPYDVVSDAPDRVYVTATGNDWAGVFLVNPVAATKLQVGCIYKDALLTAAPGNPMVYAGQRQLSPASIRSCDTSVKPTEFINAVEGPIGGNMQDLCLSPDGKRLYVCCGAPYHVQVLDGRTLSPVGQLNTGPYPRHVAVAPDNVRVYATHGGGHVDVFDANTFIHTGSFKVKGEVTNMLVTPDGLLALQFPNGMWLLDPAQITLDPAQ